MKVNSIRRVTHDHRHNACTGACWFKEDLYVGYRQADDHDGPDGRSEAELDLDDPRNTYDPCTVF